MGNSDPVDRSPLTAQRVADDRPFSPAHSVPRGGGPPPESLVSLEAQRTLLIVDDDRDVARAFASVARRHRWEVLCASTCKEARDRLTSGEIVCDVAVIDLRLTDGWGLDLVASLHAPPLLCAGIVAITGLQPSAELAASVYARGASLLWKPVSVRALAQALDAAHTRTVELRRIVHATAPIDDVDHATTPLDRLFELAAERFLLDDDELRVVRRICEERTDREIAAEFGVSESALKRLQAVIRGKMGVETRSGVVRKVYEAALNDHDDCAAPVQVDGTSSGRIDVAERSTA